MNLQQARAITYCRWEYYSFGGCTFQPTIEQAFRIINILSSKHDLNSSDDVDQYLYDKLLSDVFNDIDALYLQDKSFGFEPLAFSRSLVNGRFYAIQCLAEYLDKLETNLIRDVNSLDGIVQHYLQEQGLL